MMTKLEFYHNCANCCNFFQEQHGFQPICSKKITSYSPDLETDGSYALLNRHQLSQFPLFLAKSSTL